jgi:tRNA threonylcarbamoyladenosine biosynthesis protein TsaB
MRVLAVDTATETGSVAVLADGVLLAEIAARVSALHGETLMPHIERALASAGLGPGDLDLLAVGLGPGSFTGVRIGVATIKGLAIALGRPVVGVRSSRVIARGAFGALRVVATDARKSEVYASAFEASPDGTLTTRIEDVHGEPRDVGARIRASLGDAGIVVVGSALRAQPSFLVGLGAPSASAPPVLEQPRAAILALEAVEALASRGPDDAASLEPAYVRGADAILPGKG